MTIADSRVVSRWKVTLSADYEFLYMEIADDGAWVTYDAHKEALSLLAEAESRVVNLENSVAAMRRTRDEMQGNLIALQSRLDAVVGLADDMAKRSAELLEDHCTVAAEEVEGYEKQLRSAALGGESCGNEEVG